MTFAQLYVSQAFTFMAETEIPLYAGARGPWVKVGPRTYRALVDGHAHGPTIRVGTAKVAVTPNEGVA
jgi:hypothetical protein